MLPAKPYYRNIMDKIGLDGLSFNSREALVSIKQLKLTVYPEK